MFAKQQEGGGYGTCFSAFGARKVSIEHLVCCEQHGDVEGVIDLQSTFCEAYPAGETNITVAHVSWFKGTRDLCGGDDDQFENEPGLSGAPLSKGAGGCQGYSGKGLCSGGCSWVNNGKSLL